MDSPNPQHETAGLALNGTTIQQKKDLLGYAIEEKTRLVEAGKAQNAYFGLAGTCIEILGTSKAAIAEIEKINGANTEADQTLAANLKQEWVVLYNQCAEIAKESVDVVNKLDKATWSPTDFETIGTIILRTGDHTPEEINQSIAFFEEGIARAEQIKDAAGRASLYAQLVRAAMATENAATVDQSIQNLYSVILHSPTLEAKNLTRLYRALAEGAKHLSIHYAQSAGSENQELKARNI